LTIGVVYNVSPVSLSPVIKLAFDFHRFHASGNNDTGKNISPVLFDTGGDKTVATISACLNLKINIK
jgi:hypothetical protein